MGQTVGYARVSTTGQSLEVQREKLTAAGCNKVFEEKRSAGYGSPRPELKACLDYVRDGDTLVITRLDRMARSVIDLARIAERLRSHSIDLRVLDQGIDTSTSEGRLMFHMLGAFAEFENDIRRERQKDGIEKARKKGVRFGRRAALSEEQREKLRQLRQYENYSIRQLQERFHVGRSTVYRALRE